MSLARGDVGTPGRLHGGQTDLERCVNDPGRNDLVEQVREKINKLGIDYLY